MVAGGGCGKKADAPKNVERGPGRPTEIVCPAERPPGRLSTTSEGQDCTKDDQCTAGSNGRCMTVGSRDRQNKCTYDTCFHDADCKTGGPCDCQPGGNVCLPGNCRTDADCGAGGSCGRSRSICGDTAPAYYCRTNDDTCADSCGNNQQCVFLPQVGHWGCVEITGCPVG